MMASVHRGRLLDDIMHSPRMFGGGGGPAGDKIPDNVPLIAVEAQHAFCADQKHKFESKVQIALDEERVEESLERRAPVILALQRHMRELQTVFAWAAGPSNPGHQQQHVCRADQLQLNWEELEQTCERFRICPQIIGCRQFAVMCDRLSTDGTEAISLAQFTSLLACVASEAAPREDPVEAADW